MENVKKNLLKSAQDAALKAYAPYSQFRVGAAVLADGQVFEGANIENASSNLGICAERVAISHAWIHQAKSIEGIALFCLDAPKNENGQLSTNHCIPCGACLQWMAEFAPNAWLVTNASDNTYALSELLPEPFTLE